MSERWADRIVLLALTALVAFGVSRCDGVTLVNYSEFDAMCRAAGGVPDDNDCRTPSKIIELPVPEAAR